MRTLNLVIAEQEGRLIQVNESTFAAVRAQSIVRNLKDADAQVPDKYSYQGASDDWIEIGVIGANEN